MYICVGGVEGEAGGGCGTIFYKARFVCISIHPVLDQKNIYYSIISSSPYEHGFISEKKNLYYHLISSPWLMREDNRASGHTFFLKNPHSHTYLYNKDYSFLNFKILNNIKIEKIEIKKFVLRVRLIKHKKRKIN